MPALSSSDVQVVSVNGVEVARSEGRTLVPTLEEFHELVGLTRTLLLAVLGEIDLEDGLLVEMREQLDRLANLGLFPTSSG